MCMGGADGEPDAQAVKMAEASQAKEKRVLRASYAKAQGLKQHSVFWELLASKVSPGRESRACREGPGHPPQEVTLMWNMFTQNSLSTCNVPGSLPGIRR